MPLDLDQTLRRAPAPSRESFLPTPAGEILLVNWQSATAAEVRESMEAVKCLLTRRRARTLVLFEVAGMRWDAKLPFEAIPWVKEISPLTARVAIVGVAGLQLSVLAGLRSLTKLPLPVFADRAEAIAWLTRPRGANVHAPALAR